MKTSDNEKTKKNLSAAGCLRAGFATATRFWDGVCVFAELAARRARRLLDRLIDVDALRSEKRKKRGYWPVFERLEARTVPTLEVSAGTIDTVAGQVWPGSSAINRGGFMDPNGFVAPYTVTIAWGDGTGDSAGWFDLGDTGEIFGTHTYMTAGTYTFTISVTGHSDSGSGSGTFDVSTGSSGATLTTANSSQVQTSSFDATTAFSLLTGAVQVGVSLNGSNLPVCGCSDPGLVLNYNGASVGVIPTIQVPAPLAESTGRSRRAVRSRPICRGSCRRNRAKLCTASTSTSASPGRAPFFGPSRYGTVSTSCGGAA